MARTRRSHSRSRRMRRTRSQRGGDLAGNPPSSWGWGLGTLGNGWDQFRNSLMLQPGENTSTMNSNNSVPVGRLNAQSSQPNIGANLSGAIPKMSGGRRRYRNRKGGNFGAILGQAAVPGLLLAGQQMYGRRKSRRQ